MSARAVNWMAQIRPTAFYGTPTYALHLAETSVKEGLDASVFGLKQLIFSGEPGASIPSVIEKLETAFGAKVFVAFGEKKKF